MLISDLLRYRDLVKSKIVDLDFSQSFLKANNAITQLSHSNRVIGVDAKLEHARNEYQRLELETINIKSYIESVLDDINEAIDTHGMQVHTNTDVDFYSHYHLVDFQLDSTVIDTIKARIHHNTNWCYPGLQLGCTPQSKILTGELVSNDPLYLCDFEQQRIDDISNQFNDIYNNRLRKYIIKDHTFAQLPHNQFGFVFSWMLFNYSNIETIKYYLRQVLTLLRPGGQMIFSYNNTELLESCIVTEKGGMSYVPKNQLIKICQDIGFEVVISFDEPNTDLDVKWISWLEIKKPGKLSSVKLSQVLGSINTK